MTLNIPTDVILQILSRLSSKTIARFRCVSKLWASLLTLDSSYFTELFLTQSITRPRLLFGIENNEKWYLYSSLQPHEISSKNSESSISVTAEFHMSLPKTWSLNVLSGLIYLPDIQYINCDIPMICNPSTRNCLWLPNLTRPERSFLGYNPINKQFRVLAFSYSGQDLPTSCQILNLESGRLFWRSLDCPLHHCPLASHICINGILYYIATFWTEDPCKIVCFDLNSEEFKFIDQPWGYGAHLVNFKGKLGVITIKGEECGKEGEGLNIELTLCVLEDVEEEEWSKYVYLLPSILWNGANSHHCVVGVTGTGDAVFYTVNPFYVYFFNFKKNILRKVEIKGLEAFNHNELQCCVDYVEDLKALNSS